MLKTDDRKWRFVLRTALVAALGGLLFGYDTAVISGAIGFLTSHFDLNPMQQGWAVSCTLIGCIVGAASAGWMSDRYGRKRILILSAILFMISAVWSALPHSLSEFVIARMIGGFGVGIASMLSPLYISEMAPARLRGRLVSLNQFAIIFGMLLVCFVNARIVTLGTAAWQTDYSWRWMLGSEVLPAGLFWLLLYTIPESPRWLVQQGHTEEAQAILTRIDGAAHAESELQEISKAIAMGNGSIRELLKPGIRIALMIGIVLAILQQVTGIQVVLYYAPEIFKQAGISSAQALNHTVIVGAVNLLFTLVSLWIVDKVGRKPLLLIASVGMGLSLSVLGCTFYFELTGPWVLGAVLAYVASFAVAMGPVVWVVMSEIFPTRIRGRAMSICTSILWIACFMMSQFFPSLLEKFQGNVFFLYAVMCAVSFLFVLFCIPETKQKSLEDIERSWSA
jgi:SP family arabinose:H+ symporter-like MFS transporter